MDRIKKMFLSLAIVGVMMAPAFAKGTSTTSQTKISKADAKTIAHAEAKKKKKKKKKKENKENKEKSEEMNSIFHA